jgi:hypothetical protein
MLTPAFRLVKRDPKVGPRAAMVEARIPEGADRFSARGSPLPSPRR